MMPMIMGSGMYDAYDEAFKHYGQCTSSYEQYDKNTGTDTVNMCHTCGSV